MLQNFDNQDQMDIISMGIRKSFLPSSRLRWLGLFNNLISLIFLTYLVVSKYFTASKCPLPCKFWQPTRIIINFLLHSARTNDRLVIKSDEELHQQETIRDSGVCTIKVIIIFLLNTRLLLRADKNLIEHKQIIITQL